MFKRNLYFSLFKPLVFSLFNFELPLEGLGLECWEIEVNRKGIWNLLGWPARGLNRGPWAKTLRLPRPIDVNARSILRPSPQLVSAGLYSCWVFLAFSVQHLAGIHPIENSWQTDQCLKYSYSLICLHQTSFLSNLWLIASTNWLRRTRQRAPISKDYAEGAFWDSHGHLRAAFA